VNAALCPCCAGRNPRCPLCKGRGIFDASNPATVPMLNGMGFWAELGSGLASTGASIVKGLAESFPDIATTALSALVAAKLGGGAAPAATSGGAAQPAAAPAAQPAKQQQAAPSPQAVYAQATPAGQQAVYYTMPAQQPVSSLPGWVLPVGLVVGGMVVAVGMVAVLRKKATD